MVNRVDGVILGVGVVVLVASIIGVVLYDEEGTSTFTIGWAEADAVALEEQTDNGGPQEYTFTAPVDGTNIASVVFTVDVSANGQQVSDDSVDVAVSGPQDQSSSCQFTISAVGGSSNSCEATADVNPRPDGFSVSAQNRTDAEQMASERVANDNGTGDWEVTVTIDGGAEVSDPSYQIAVTPSVVEWAPQASLPSTGPGPGPG